MAIESVERRNRVKALGDLHPLEAPRDYSPRRELKNLSIRGDLLRATLGMAAATILFAGTAYKINSDNPSSPEMPIVVPNGPFSVRGSKAAAPKIFPVSTSGNLENRITATPTSTESSFSTPK